MNKNAIVLERAVKNYPHFTLGEISFAVPAGCIVGLIGENGAGKTTLSRLLLGIEKRDAGKVEVLGCDEIRLYPAVRDRIGFVLEDSGFPAEMTGTEVADLMKGIYTRWDDAVFAEITKCLGLKLKERCGRMSDGQRMKLMIAIAMSHHAELLVMDEPTGHLDPAARMEVTELLHAFTEDETHTVFISSHIVSDLEKIADYVIFLHEGKVLLFEEKDALLDRYCKVDAEEKIPNAVALRKSQYSCEAIVERKNIQAEEYVPVTLEELFVAMVKGVF